ncbi:MAG: hypothetical protein NT149_03795 [Candidatus Gottesmanbacteria bacterium]|nr:hypothetical protein [Candidatus Gottesmanbacteria bacterium]
MNITKKLPSPGKIVVLVLLAGILVYLLYWRWQVSQIRQFDVDEFSHLHWAAQVARGQRPYADFFTYFSPGFMWVLTPIFWIYGVSWSVFTVARTVSFVIFLGMLGSLGYLFGITRGWKWALLPVVILAFLPMPYDKFLEIRPDNLATLLATLGVIGEVIAIQKKKNIWWVVSGFFYGLSLLFLIKMAPFVIVGIGIAGWVSYQRKITQGLTSIVGGLLIPLAGLFSWSVLTGTMHAMWRALLITPVEIFTHLNDFMAASLFFHPNSAFYGGNGQTITAGLVVNHALWICAIFVGTYRVLTPYVKARGNTEGVQTEILLALTFLLVACGYVKFFPSKYSQYLIPVAVFVAYYAADGISLFFDWLERAGGYASLVIVIGGCVYILGAVTLSVNVQKLNFTNVGQRVEFEQLVRTVPLSARVVDLDGRMLFWANGYPACCLPFDYYLPYVTNAPQSLALYLPAHPADYLYDGEGTRLAMLSFESLAYVRSHFVPVAGWGERLWKRL